jgi:glutamyl-tRNA reductase
MATTIGSTHHVAHHRDDARDLIAALRDRAEAIRHEELRRLGGWQDGLCPGDRVRLEMLTRSIVEALLHEATARLRGDDHGADVEAARFLFALEDAGLGHPRGTP